MESLGIICLLAEEFLVNVKSRNIIFLTSKGWSRLLQTSFQTNNLSIPQTQAEDLSIRLSTRHWNAEQTTEIWFVTYKQQSCLAPVHESCSFKVLRSIILGGGRTVVLAIPTHTHTHNTHRVAEFHNRCYLEIGRSVFFSKIRPFAHNFRAPVSRVHLQCRQLGVFVCMLMISFPKQS